MITREFPKDQVVSRPGQINGAGDARELFLKLYAGEVLRMYKHKCIMKDLHRTRNIKKGKEVAFPIIGKTKPKYHKPGQLIEGDVFSHQERIVTVDDMAICPQFLSNIDEAMNHYDIRGPYTEEAGYALAGLYDRNVLRMACKASFITDKDKADAAGVPAVDGEVYTNNITLGAAGDELKGDKLVKAIYDAKVEMEEKSVTGEPFVVLRPAQYYSLFSAEDVTKLTWLNKDVGGEGSMAKALVPMIAGMDVHMSNHLPKEDESKGLKGDEESLINPTKYRGDYSKVVGLVMTEHAVATATLMDLSSEAEYQAGRQGTFMVSKFAVGHNILKPAEAVTILKKEAA